MVLMFGYQVPSQQRAQMVNNGCNSLNAVVHRFLFAQRAFDEKWANILSHIFKLYSNKCNFPRFV